MDGFSLDMGAFVFTSTYDTAFLICEELGLPLVPSQVKFGHYRSGRWVTTTPEQSPRPAGRHQSGQGQRSHRASGSLKRRRNSGLWRRQVASVRS